MSSAWQLITGHRSIQAHNIRVVQEAQGLCLLLQPIGVALLQHTIGVAVVDGMIDCSTHVLSQLNFQLTILPLQTMNMQDQLRALQISTETKHLPMLRATSHLDAMPQHMSLVEQYRCIRNLKQGRGL